MCEHEAVIVFYAESVHQTYFRSLEAGVGGNWGGDMEHDDQVIIKMIRCDDCGADLTDALSNEVIHS